jgi:hypothetical protein
MKLYFQEVIGLFAANKDALEQDIKNTRRLRELINFFCDNNQAIQGEAATAIKAYLREFHGALLFAREDAAVYFMKVFARHCSELLAIDDNTDAAFESNYIKDYAYTMNNISTMLVDDDAKVTSFVAKYQEYLRHDKPSIEVITDMLFASKGTAESGLERLDEVNSRYVEDYENIVRQLEAIQLACKSKLLTADGLNYEPGDYLKYSWSEGLFVSDAAIDFIYETFFDGDNIVFPTVRQVVGKGEGMSRVEYLALLKLLELADFSADGNTRTGQRVCTGDDLLLIFQTHDTVVVTNPENGMRYDQNVPLLDPDKILETINMLANEYSGLTSTYANQLLADGILMISDYESTSEFANLKKLLELSQFFVFARTRETIIPSDFDLSQFADDTGGVLYYQGKEYQKSDTGQLLVKTDDYIEDQDNILDYHAPDSLDERVLALLVKTGDFTFGELIPGYDEVKFTCEFMAGINDIAKELFLNGDITLEEYKSVTYNFSAANRRLGGGEAYIQTREGGGLTNIATTTTPQVLINQGALANEFDYINTPEDVWRILSDKNSEHYNEVVSYVAGSSTSKTTYIRSLSEKYELAHPEDLDRPMDHLSFDILSELINEVSNEK